MDIFSHPFSPQRIKPIEGFSSSSFTLYHKFLSENPFIPGNSFCKSMDRVLTIDFPQPRDSCFLTIKRYPDNLEKENNRLLLNYIYHLYLVPCGTLVSLGCIFSIDI